MPDQGEDDDDRDRYAQEPEKNTASHNFLLMSTLPMASLVAWARNAMPSGRMNDP
jgi:hypothetical protein